MRTLRKRRDRADHYLDGQLLVAMPLMTDKRFARSVIYICAHSAEGAMGLIVNQRAPNIRFAELLQRLSISPNEGEALGEDIDLDVHVGGPVETERGFVLHSADYYTADATLAIDEDVSLTATIDILKAIAKGNGPKSAILALGYAGWAPGQLENEIQHNGWLHCSADLDLIFGQDTGGKYEKAMRKIGIDLGMLSSEAGHA